MNNSGTLKWIIKRIKKFIPLLVLVSFLDALSAVLGVVLALVSKQVLDTASASDGNMIWLFGGLLLGCSAANILIISLVSIINVRFVGRLTISMRCHMFSSLVHKRYGGISGHHSGDLVNRFTSDIDVVVSAVTSTLPHVVSMITKLIAGFIALMILNWKLALIVLVAGFTVPFFGRFISRRYKYLHKEVQKTEGEARSFLQESFANVVVIKSFLSEKPILDKFNQYMQKNLKIKIKRNFITVTINALLHIFFNLGYYLVLLWGATQFASGLSYGTLNAYLQLISQLRAPLQNISDILPQYYAAIASAERLIDLENIETEPQLLDDTASDKLKTEFREIVIDNVAFAYEDELILKNCSFKLEGNRITAITGESGCGKSTLFKLMLGLYEPTGGSITINGETPVNASTRSLFSYVPQGNMILSGTIRENITMCNADISEDEVMKAAKAADIYDYIVSLPDGFNTVLAERGAGLSEGQIQRLSIARALLFDAPVLLLDEATSALDEQTEVTVLSNIKQMTDKTVVFITHRNTSLAVCDHIVHVENKKFEMIK